MRMDESDRNLLLNVCQSIPCCAFCVGGVIKVWLVPRVPGANDRDSCIGIVLFWPTVGTLWLVVATSPACNKHYQVPVIQSILSLTKSLVKTLLSLTVFRKSIVAVFFVKNCKKLLYPKVLRFFLQKW